MNSRRTVLQFMAATGVCLAVNAVNAQVPTPVSLTSKPIKILVGYAPGGGADLTARVYGQKLQEILGTPVIVENRPGAFEQLAAQPVATAAADANVFWLGTAGALTMAPAVKNNLPYDVLKSFTHISKLGEVNAVLAVKKGIPANNLQEFVAYAKANPGKLNYASAGVGAGNHLMTEYIMGLTDISMVHIPFKGDADVIRELAAGSVDFGIITIATGAPFISDGRVKGLAVSGDQRAKALPNVPTLQESATSEPLKNYGVYSIYGLLGPAGMNPTVTQALSDALKKISAMPDINQRLENGNVRVGFSTPAELKQYLEKEIAKWREVGKRVKIE